MLTTDDMLAAAIRARPDLASVPVRMLAGSWDSVALDFGGRVICKFPRHARAEAALRREVRLLAALRGRLRMPVPEMRLHEGPMLFSSHPKLPGAALTAEVYAAQPEAMRAATGLALGRFYADLHAVPEAVVRQAGAEAIGEWLTPGKIRPALALLPGGLRDLAGQVLTAWEDLPPDPFGPTYGFFDGHGWNMAFDPGSGLNGVFDFADSGFGPLHQDFVYANFISSDLTDRIIASYGAETGRAIDSARVDLLTSAFRLHELAAARGGDPAHLALMSRNAVDWLTSGRAGC
jgi:aminoglycoside phosphotransferase (APT) family kinase protein